jgi:crotonobetainyl-CoA:carnitine CoA-transferase CaiB-like acyl-CoA transferase
VVKEGYSTRFLQASELAAAYRYKTLHSRPGLCYAGVGPQVLKNGYLSTYEHPRFGTLQAVGPMACCSKTDSVQQGPAPEEPGQYTQGILANTGLTSEEIAHLRAHKVVS